MVLDPLTHLRKRRLRQSTRLIFRAALKCRRFHTASANSSRSGPSHNLTNMSLRNTLNDLKDSVSAAWTNSPDEYPEWSSWTFETHMADLRALWTSAESKLKNRENAQLFGADLMRMIAAFEAGDKSAGRSLAGKLYNEQISKLS